MFDRFTDRAKKVMSFARQEAMRFDHEYIGTEHILLGLVQEGTGVASIVLKNMNVDLERVRHEVEKIVKTGPSMVGLGQLPFTPRAKKVLELSMEEASHLRHNYIGTEHLLLGLIRENEGIAAQVMMNLGVKVEEVREEVLELTAGCSVPAADERQEPTAAARDSAKEVLRALANRILLRHTESTSFEGRVFQPHMRPRIVSGGQTGVDRAALDVAIELGLPHGGWCPLGRLAEDGRIPDGYVLKETATSDTRERTRCNVIDTDATLLLVRGEPTGGTAYALEVCVAERKPHLVVDLYRDAFEQIGATQQWLAAVRPQTLNVAGPRQSSVEGIYGRARDFLRFVMIKLLLDRR